MARKSAEQSLNVWEVQGENYWQTSWYIPVSEESVLGAGAKPLITFYICDKYVLKKIIVHLVNQIFFPLLVCA